MCLWRLFENHFFLCQSSVLITTRCFCRRTTVLKKGAQRYECCPSVGPSEGFLCLGLPVAEICAFYFLCICFQTIYSSEFHKLRTTLTNNLFHDDHTNKISSCWSWIPTSFFPNFQNVPFVSVPWKTRFYLQVHSLTAFCQCMCASLIPPPPRSLQTYCSQFNIFEIIEQLNMHFFQYCFLTNLKVLVLTYK